MKGYKEIICEICGKRGTVPNKRKLNYCNDLECERMMKEIKRKEAKDRFNAKNKISSQPIVEEEKKVKVWQPQETRTVNTTAYENLDISDIRELSRQLGTIRYTLIQMIEKERAKIESAGKFDDTLIHSFEFENLTKEQVWEKYLETKQQRTNRRQNRYRYTIIKGILDSIKIKNPDKYVVMAINGCKSTRDFDKYIEELKEDKELFAN